jgi:hypothetical protein
MPHYFNRNSDNGSLIVELNLVLFIQYKNHFTYADLKDLSVVKCEKCTNDPFDPVNSVDTQQLPELSQFAWIASPIFRT